MVDDLGMFPSLDPATGKLRRKHVPLPEGAASSEDLEKFEKEIALIDGVFWAGPGDPSTVWINAVRALGKTPLHLRQVRKGDRLAPKLNGASELLFDITTFDPLTGAPTTSTVNVGSVRGLPGTDGRDGSNVLPTDEAIAGAFDAEGSKPYTSVASLVKRHWGEIPVSTMSGATTTAKFKAAVDAAMNEGGSTVVFGPGVHTITSETLFSGPVSVRGYSGTSNVEKTTVIDYRGPANSAFLRYDTLAGSSDWMQRIKYSDFVLRGNSTAVESYDATVDGISIATPPGETYLNVAYLSFHRVFFRRLRTALELDGYGHHIQECMASGCTTGYDFAHPEQVMLINSWASYCDRGVTVNTRKKPYGHKFHILGGSYQRCRIGIEIQNFMEPSIDTYFELNKDADILLGDKTAPNDYANGVKGAEINMFTASKLNDTGASLDIYAGENTRVRFESGGGSNPSKPHVRVSGSSKGTEIRYGTITSSSPWNVRGDAQNRTSIAPIGVADPVLMDVLSPFTNQTNRSLTRRLLPTGEVQLRGGVESNNLTGGNIIARLPAGWRPSSTLSFSVPMWNQANNTWGSSRTVDIQSSGEILYQGGSADTRLLMDSIRFMPKADWSV